MIDAALALLYSAAVLARDAWIWLWRPQTVGVRVLVVRQGSWGSEVLLVRHRAGRQPWEIPGGAVDHGETITAAACREVQEEAGASVRVDRIHGAFDNFRRWRSDTVLVLIATPLSEPRPHGWRSLEIAEVRYFPLGALPVAQLGPGSRRCIAQWQRGESGTLGNWWDS